MWSFKVCAVLAVAVLASASPAAPNKDAFLGSSFEEMRSMCNEDDALACIKFKAMSFLDNLFKKDNYQLSDDIEINRNSYRSNEISGRGESSLEDTIQSYIQTHDVTFKLPVGGSEVTVGGRNLDQDELNLKFKFSGVEEARKSKLKKILVPIMVFVLLKAITLIPLGLGVLGLKAWNALQLSFFSFIVSVSLAVFQLCKKIAADGAHPHLGAHGGWDPAALGHYAARSSDTAAQEMAYSAYKQ